MNVLILASDNYFPLIIFALVIIAIPISIYFNKRNVILRELKKSNKTQINRARQHEYVKIVGTAIGGNEPLIAPLSGRPCFYYYVIVEKKGDKSWHTYFEEERCQDFFIEANGERAMIKPALTLSDYRKTYFVIDHEDASGSFNDAKPHLEKFLRKHGKESKGLFGFNKTLRFKEGIIEPNESIAIKGIAEWKAFNEPIEGYSYSKILTLKGTREQKLIITDDPEGVDSDKKRKL